MNDKNDGDNEGVAELLSEVEIALESVEESLSDVDDFEEFGNDELESLLGDVDTLARVAREIGELLEADQPVHLLGPTGCGKTALALSTASERGRPVV